MFCSIIIDKKEGDNMENITMLDMQSNDMLSELNKSELEELRKEIKNASLLRTPLELRLNMKICLEIL